MHSFGFGSRDAVLGAVIGAALGAVVGASLDAVIGAALDAVIGAALGAVVGAALGAVQPLSVAVQPLSVRSRCRIFGNQTYRIRPVTKKRGAFLMTGACDGSDS